MKFVKKDIHVDLRCCKINYNYTNVKLELHKLELELQTAFNLFEKYINISAHEMASLGNRHCANCIGAVFCWQEMVDGPRCGGSGAGALCDTDGGRLRSVIGRRWTQRPRRSHHVHHTAV